MNVLIKTFFASVITLSSTFAQSGPVLCPLTHDEMSLLLESAVRNRQEAAWIITQSAQSTFPTRGFSRNLIGSNSAHTGVFTLIEQCTGPRTFDKFCEPCQEQNCPAEERCSQLACKAAGIDTAKIWWQPAPFTYRTDQPNLRGFRVTYSKKPTTLIRYDGTSPGELNITWSANDKVDAKRGKIGIQVSSVLEGRGLKTEEGPQNAHVEIRYPLLVDNSETRVIFDINEHGTVSGEVTVGQEKVGNIVETQGEQVARIEWIGDCANP